MPEYTETLYLIPDWDHAEAVAMWNSHGTMIDGTPVIVENLMAGWVDSDPTCEDCRETSEPLYQLHGATDMTGIPICRDCLEDQPWVKTIVEDRSTLMFREETLPDE